MLLRRIYIQGNEVPASSIILSKGKWPVSDSLQYLFQSFKMDNAMLRSSIIILSLLVYE